MSKEVACLNHPCCISWIFFSPTSRKVLPTFQTYCPVWVSFGSSFCPHSSSGQEKGWFGVGFGSFCGCTYPERGLWRLSKGEGLVVVSKWVPIWAEWDPSGQCVRKVGKSAPEFGKKIQSFTFLHLWNLLATDIFHASAPVKQASVTPILPEVAFFIYLLNDVGSKPQNRQLPHARG